MLDATKRGDILGFVRNIAVANGTIAVDQAVRAIEKKPMMTFVKPIPEMVTKEHWEGQPGPDLCAGRISSRSSP